MPLHVSSTCASNWLITEINILRSTVSKTSKFIFLRLWWIYLNVQKKSITPVVKKTCELYFGCTVGIRTKSGHHIFAIFMWLTHWHSPINDIRSPYVWREQNNHLANCYFCWTKIVGHNSKFKCTLFYPNILSALRPVEHEDSLLIIKPTQPWTLHEEEPTSTSPEDERGPSCSHVNSNFPERTLPLLL